MNGIFELVIKKLIKNPNDIKSKEGVEAYATLGGIVGVVINSTILIIELIIGLYLNSIAVAADAIHNLTDAISSLVAIISVKLSNRPADDKHPFGHGRIEYITSLIFSVAIFVIGYEFIKNSLNRIINPVEVKFNLFTFILMLIALPLQIFLNRFLTYIGKKINSASLKAAAVESYTDILVLTMVIVSLLITRFTTFPIDGYVALIVSGFIIKSGYELLTETLDSLLGKAPDIELISSITNKIIKYPHILGVHDIVIHNYGPNKYMASLHAEVPEDIPILEIHDIIDQAEKDIGQELNLYLVIHMDPINKKSEEVLKLKDEITYIISNLNGVISMHDFRVIGQNNDKKIFFDLVIERKLNTSIGKEKLAEVIHNEVTERYPKYKCIITFDTEFN